MTDTPTTGKPATASTASDLQRKQEPPKQQEYEFHPIASIFPLMSGDEFDRFKEDIRTRMQQEPIILYQGKILDGRNRYNACKALYREPNVEEYKGSDPLGYVLSANLHRRHLKESQRAVIAANLVTTKLGDNQHIKREGRPIDLATAAKMLNVSEKSVKRAKKILENGDPALVQAVKDGKLRVSAAEDFSKSHDQDKLIAECKGNVVEAVKKLPKPPSTSKKKPESPKSMMERIDRFLAEWDQLNGTQKRRFVKTNQYELGELLEELEAEAAEEEEEEEEDQASLS
jgi:ParB family chromosome partitioning protein